MSDSVVEVVVVGAGPGGLATAIACRLRGLEVTVLERCHRLPIDKACGEGLMPDAVACLERLGVRPRGREIEGIRYLDRSTSVTGTFPSRPGLGVRRTELSRALGERARTLGVELREGVEVTGLESVGEGATGWQVVMDQERSRPAVVVGADGLHSRCRAWARLEAPPSARRRVGLRRHLCAQAPRRVEVHWTEGVEAYLTPVGEDEVGLAFLFEPPARSADRGGPPFEHLLSRFPRLHERFAGSPALSAVRGAGPLRQGTRGHVRGNLALVGDAGGYVDAITGEGMAIAFAEAEALAERLGEVASEIRDPRAVRAALRRFQRDARRQRRLSEALTRGALHLARHPRWRRRFLRALARHPGCFDRLLALHVRESPARSALPMALEVGWRLARG